MTRKEELIAGLIEIRTQILGAVSDLPPGRQDEVFLGSWSIKDLLAHLVGWDYANIDAVEDIRAGKPPRVFEHWNPDWTAYNAQLVRRYKRDDFAELLESVRQSHHALIDTVRALPAADITKDFGVRSSRGRNITVDWFLQFEVEDEGRHYRQIQDWLTEDSPPRGGS